MLEKNPLKRISAEKALTHPFFNEMDVEYDSKKTGLKSPLNQNYFKKDEDVEVATCISPFTKQDNYMNFNQVPQDN